MDGGYGGLGGGGFGTGSSDTGGGAGNFGGFRGDGNRAGFDINQAMNYRRIHGILAALAMVVLFPVGSILMRVVPGRFAIWVHVAFQVLAFGIYVAAAGLGISLVRMVRIPGGGLVSYPLFLSSASAGRAGRSWQTLTKRA